MTMKTIKPARTGLVVKDPFTLDPISENGSAVDISIPYWQRRLRDGDIVVVEAKAATTKATESKIAVSTAVKSE